MHAALPSVLALIDVVPPSVAIAPFGLPIYWYGICYALGLAATYTVVTREARRRGLPARFVDNGIIYVAIAALFGGRLYHVIDQWDRYKGDWVLILLPLARNADGSLSFAGFTGLGVYGGILTGTITAFLIIRWWKQPFWKWADAIAPGIFTMQAFGRWGNFFNQELYGPPTDLPWGITIDCAHRVAPYSCDTLPAATTGFQPLFLYESLSGALGAVTLLWLARRYGQRLRPGDLVLLFFAWYAAVRLALEALRVGNWTINGIPTATLISIVVIAGSLAIMAWRHRPGAGGERWDDAPVADAANEDGDEGWYEDDEPAGDAGDGDGDGDGEPDADAGDATAADAGAGADAARGGDARSGDAAG